MLVTRSLKHGIQRGFTLIELMVAISLFAVIMTISMGAILNTLNLNQKTRSVKTVMDNLDFSLETMSREMRFGTNYHCETSIGVPPPYTAPKNCVGGGVLVSFLSNDGLQTVYRLNGTVIEKSVNGGLTYIPVTGSEMTIRSLVFYVFGAAASDSLQPKVNIKIQGFAGSKPSTNTSFTVQTMVSQRGLDN